MVLEHEESSEVLHPLLRSVLDIDADSRLCHQRLELLCQVPIPGLAALKTPCHAFVRQSDVHPLSLIPYPLSLIPYPLSLIPYPLSLISQLPLGRPPPGLMADPEAVARAGSHRVSYGPQWLPLRPQGRDLADRLHATL